MNTYDRFSRGRMGRIAMLSLILVLPWAMSLAQATSPQTAAAAVHGFVPANMDRSVKPGDNFFLYANGDWIKRTEIPPDRGGVSGFTALLNIADKNTADIIEEAAKS